MDGLSHVISTKFFYSHLTYSFIIWLLTNLIGDIIDRKPYYSQYLLFGDNDGDLDLLVVIRGSVLLYRNEDLTFEFWLLLRQGESGNSGGGGDTDVLCNSWNSETATEQFKLFRNEGGKFVDEPLLVLELTRV